MSKTSIKATETKWNDEYAVELCAGEYKAIVLPNIGANIISLTHSRYNADILRTPVDMKSFINKPQVYGIPILFPPNRISGGNFTYNGIEYIFMINEPEAGNHIHGYLVHCSFKLMRLSVKNNTHACAVFEFSSDENSKYYGGLPNSFNVRAEYILSEEGLIHEISIINKSDIPLPLGLGFHTAFRVPFIKKSTVSGCKLLTSVNHYWPLNMNHLPVGYTDTDYGKREQLRKTGIEPLGTIPNHWDSRSITYKQQKFNGAILRDEDSGIDLVYEVDELCKYWVIWNDGGDKNFVCVEPQTWMINAPNSNLPEETSGFTAIPAQKSMVFKSKLSLTKINSNS